MPTESRLTDEEIHAAWNDCYVAHHGSDVQKFARRIERIVAERIRGAHCEGCHVPNICRGFLRGDGAEAARLAGKEIR